MASEVNEGKLEGELNEETTAKEESRASKLSAHSGYFAQRLSTIVEEDTSTGGKLASGGKRKALLAQPKIEHLREIMRTYKNLDPKFAQNIKMKIQEQGRNPKHTKQAKILDESVEKGFARSQKIYENLESKLRRTAFDTLASKLFAKLPELIISMQRKDTETLAADTKILYETLHSTLAARIGHATNEHEERIYSIICFGLTKFVQSIIENVGKEQQDVEMLVHNDHMRFSVPVELARNAFKEHMQTK